jgi:DNA repair protein RecO (recombination protein O)
MIVKTKGIVLSYMKYGDNSIIARIFTEDYGYGSYIVNSIRSQKSKKSIGYFQPFTILDLVLYIKDTRDLQRISEFKSHHPLHQIYQNLTKSTITLFLTEMLSKLLQSEQAPNETLYEFVEDAVITFDKLEIGVQDFHIQFLLKIGPFLGFGIDDFETLFTSIDKLVPTSEDDHLMEKLINEPFGFQTGFTRPARNQVLDAILNYYRHHAHIAKPKSLDVLRSVLD